MLAQAHTFPVTENVQIVASFENGEYEARWHCRIGTLAIVDVETGYRINDVLPKAGTFEQAVKLAHTLWTG